MRKSSNPIARTVATLKSPAFVDAYERASAVERIAFDWRINWLSSAHKHQVLPAGDDWSIWLLLAGRGAGKTRTAAEQIAWWAWTMPETRWLVAAPTFSDVQDTCFLGDSGLRAVIPHALVKKHLIDKNEIHLINGSTIRGIPASEPERFRGPQFHGAWCLIAGTAIAMHDGSSLPIEDVRTGHYVATRFGSRKVLASGSSGNPNSLVRVTTEDQSVITLTVDHPMLVSGKWVAAGEIKIGDLLCKRDTSASAVNTLTESYTNSITEKSPQAGSCITSMKTSQTIASRISGQCLAASIKHCTLRVARAVRRSVQRQLERSNLCASKGVRRACIALRSLSADQRTSSENSVVDRVLKSGVATDLFRKLDRAPSATKSMLHQSQFKNTAQGDAIQSQRTGSRELLEVAVKSVEHLPNAQTYSLRVDDVHEHFANDFVVHNCDELAAWRKLDEAWSQIKYCVRLGQRTRKICTTTPRPKALIRDLVARAGADVALTTASTYSNIKNLSKDFIDEVLSDEGTSRGRQEIHAELIDPEEGGIVKRGWFKLWGAEKPLPKFEYVLQSYDLATSENTKNDPSAFIVLGVFKPSPDHAMSVMIIDCWSEHKQYPDLKELIIDEYGSIYGDESEFGAGKKVDLVLIEDKSAGISMLQDLSRAGVEVRSYNPGRADKMMRLNLIAPLIKRGRVYVPESSVNRGRPRDWCDPFLNEVCSFPESAHDDYVDALSQALRILRDMGMVTIDPISDNSDYSDDDEHPAQNPYAQ
jgi:predicted phage terminase large subunit-like protein